MTEWTTQRKKDTKAEDKGKSLWKYAPSRFKSLRDAGYLILIFSKGIPSGLGSCKYQRNFTAVGLSTCLQCKSKVKFAV
jgi:hypothetical protein